MKFSCILGFHNLKPVKVFNYIDRSFGMKMPSCDVTYICQECYRVKIKTIQFTHKNIELEDFEK